MVLEIWACFEWFRYLNIIRNKLVEEVLLADKVEIRESA
jgi:hypothetical protein